MPFRIKRIRIIRYQNFYNLIIFHNSTFPKFLPEILSNNHRYTRSTYLWIPHIFFLHAT